MLTVLAVSLALTLALEEAFALAWGLRGRRELETVALVNVLTNPPAVLLYHTAVGLLAWNAVVVTAALETAAVLVEGRYYRLCSEQLRRPFLFAFLANALSYGAGQLIGRW